MYLFTNNIGYCWIAYCLDMYGGFLAYLTLWEVDSSLYLDQIVAMYIGRLTRFAKVSPFQRIFLQCEN